MSEDKKTERRKEIIGVCLDCFVEKGLTATTTKISARRRSCKTAASITTFPPRRKSYSPVLRKQSTGLKTARSASCLKISAISKA